MSDHSEEVYGPDRAERLLAMLRALAERIQALDRTGGLLERAPELQKLLGNARSELFHYEVRDRKSTRLNSSHMSISYAVFCLKKKTKPVNMSTWGYGCRMRKPPANASLPYT